MEEKKYGIFSSSQDPEKLSLTIKAFIPFVAILAAYLNLEVSESDLVQAGEIIGMILTGAITLWGIIRKFRKASV